jgi:hypothetical protein
MFNDVRIRLHHMFIICNQLLDENKRSQLFVTGLVLVHYYFLSTIGYR